MVRFTKLHFIYKIVLWFIYIAHVFETVQSVNLKDTNTLDYVPRKGSHWPVLSFQRTHVNILSGVMKRSETCVVYYI